MKVIIVGGSATGMGVAARLNRINPKAEIIVFQEKKYVSLGACGLPYFVANNFEDKNKLLARSIEEFEETGIKIVKNTQVHKIDFDKKEVYFDDKKENYDKLVISTGAYPYIPPIDGVGLQNIFTITTLEDGQNLKEVLNNKSIKSIAVMGAGFIGLEMCETLKALNKEVHLIELEDKILSKPFDEEFSQLIKEKLENQNVNLYLKKKVVEFKGDKTVSEIVFDDGCLIKVDAVILALGFKPNTEIFRKTKLNLADNNAIIVDEYGQTNITDVYSGGDAAISKHLLTGEQIYSPLATVASKMARVIADNITGKKTKFFGSIKSAALRIFDMGFARTGISESEANQKKINIKTVFIKDKDQTSYVAGQSDLYLKIIMNINSKELIGAQIAGSIKSIQRINTLVALIWSKIKVDTFLEQIDLIYAPPFAKTTDILHIALSKLNK